ncbi:DUF4865 family protein [Pseudoduganella plicata]|uniref:DUF4865 domain-containing protein n=1 Tax=Pseudoduganella plicata TaxID=321984 RepID=A0A4P7BID2_9BURK|nr:DUF4865 family protein [Pseudoduganella plicata]QBQ38140.1 DUF4865 family protein [Pseudoduganella plicata]GGZ02592.1 DUF4865 domain-containing protein [Pseudoduganella plicata]
MIAMQYSFVLPADYDMAIVHRRIAERGHMTDAFPGLLFKAYLSADKGEGSDNLYAPFYLWQHPDAMHDFLAGPGFAAVSQAFGWPSVRTWTLWHAHRRNDIGAARFATRSIVPIAPHTPLAQLREQEVAASQAAAQAGALATLAGFEPVGWSLVRFRLWRERPAEVAGWQVYEVGHMSVPPR